MPQWKLLAVVLVGLVLFAWGLLQQAGVSPSDIGETIGERASEFIAGESSATALRNVTITGTFDPVPFDLSNTPVEALTVTFPADSELLVNDVRVKATQPLMLNINKYSGILSIDSTRISLDGTAVSATANGILLDTKSSRIKIRVSSVQVDLLALTGVDVKNLRFAGLTGRVNVQDSVGINLNNQPLEATAFLGNITLENKLSLEGRARRVLISGADYKTVVS